MKQNFTHKGLTRLYFIMRVSLVNMILLITPCLQVLSADHAKGQNVHEIYVNVKVEHAPLKDVLNKIEDQAGIFFIYPPELIEYYNDVSVEKSYLSVYEVLNRVLNNIPIGFTVTNGNILLYKKNSIIPEDRSVSGEVTDVIAGVGLPGVSILIKGTTNGTTTDSEGRYVINANDNDVLIFSFVGFKSQEINIAGRSVVDVQMQEDVASLSEVVINGGYYKTTSRTKTGNIVKITSKEIEKQPVTSPLLALQARVPGLEISPMSGIPGSAVNVKIRGTNSLRSRANSDVDGNLPLYIVDGVQINSSPIPSGSNSIVEGGFDPLSTINPSNIESIEILKDADATAIYGSRGANGVILITTKNKAGMDGVSLNANFYKGIGEITKKVDMLNSSQYLQMRKEGILNDGTTAQNILNNPVLAEIIYPDLVLWDTARTVNWQDELLGGKTTVTDAQIVLNGGTGRISFSVGGGYHKETLFYPGNFGYNRYNGSMAMNYTSLDKRLSLSMTVNYGVNDYNIFNSNLLSNNALTMPPLSPSVYNADGTLNWSPNRLGLSTWSNPLSWTRTTHSSKTEQMLSNVVAGYEIFKGITFKASVGYSTIGQSSSLIVPIASLDPTHTWAATGNNTLMTGSRSSWIVEPQIVFRRQIRNHKIDAVLGSTFQQNDDANKSFFGTGYTSDALIGTLGAATDIRNNSNNYQYRYVAFFSRIGYSYHDKYFITATGRRDGSSRFGPDKRFGNFASIGAAWVFSNESFFQTTQSVLSFGKLRASYGSTGNDQIGDNKYLKTYTVTTPYHGTISFIPTALDNPNYAWEVTRKLELAIELGLFNDRVSTEAAWFRNRSFNQLLNYTLPTTTGFSFVLTNFPALVENSGFEFSILTRNVDSNGFKWSTSVNLSLPKNKLVRFDDIGDSPYSNQFKVGESLAVRRGYKLIGVNSSTGLYDFEDITGDGSITAEDQDFIRSLDTKYYGGINNSFMMGNWEWSFLFQFSSRIANVFFFPTPGSRANQPVNVLDRWRSEGDITSIQKYSNSTEALAAYERWANSDGVLEQIGFLRLKTMSLSYSVPTRFLKRTHLTGAHIYLQAQNIFTISNYKGWDPETLYNSPPLKIYSMGIQLKI